MRCCLHTLLFKAAMLVALNSWGQVPLTIDPSFEYCVTPELIEQFGQGFEVVDVSLRVGGDMITTGNKLQKVLYPGAPSGGGILLVDGSGAFVPSPFTGAGTGSITEMSNGQYFYGYKRYSSNGERDFTFGYPGLPWYDLIDWHVLDDRSVLVAGAFKLVPEGQIEYGLIKVNEWGLLDATFTPRKIGPGTNQVISRLIPLANGQFLANGSFGTYDGEFSGPVVQINADGSRDPRSISRRGKEPWGRYWNSPMGR